MKKLITLLLFFSVSLVSAQMARVQFIHNAPDAQLDTVDVYINNQPGLTNFAFREATPFIDAPAGVTLDVSILPPGVTDTAQAIYQDQVIFASNETYVVVANGVLDQQTYTTASAFSLDAYAGANEVAPVVGTTDLLVHHGSPDAPPVDIYENNQVNMTVVNNAAYGDFAPAPVPSLNYRLQVLDSTQSVDVAEYLAPLNTLNLNDSAVVVFASGFFNTIANPGPSFKVLAALADGTVIELPQTTAKTQVIHNVADPAAANVDVWVNTNKVLSNFPFREATPFVDLPANADLTVSVTAPNSSDTAGALIQQQYNLMRDSAYVIVASGVANNAIFDSVKPLSLEASPARLQANSSGNTDVLVFHGATDAGTVSVNEFSVPVGDLIPNLPYGSFAGYLGLTTADYELEVVLQPDSTPAARYSAPLQSLGLGDSAIVVLASGFVDSVKGGTNLPGFGLYAALTTGGPLVPLPVTSGLSIAAPELLNAVSIYPNPASEQVMVQIDTERNTDLELEILNLTGQVKMKCSIDSAEAHRLKIDQLSPGIYLIRIRDGQEVAVVRKLQVR